jgi:hypothetical protein
MITGNDFRWTGVGLRNPNFVIPLKIGSLKPSGLNPLPPPEDVELILFPGIFVILLILRCRPSQVTMQ